MNKWIIMILAVALVAGGIFVYSTRSANAEPLAIGAQAPDFATTGALAGKEFEFSLAEKLQNGPVVLYFFPKAFTEGCTIEANMFADATADFEAAGAARQTAAPAPGPRRPASTPPCPRSIRAWSVPC